ncbi:IclR family transcriptional regulator C-terminal domain-containing protein [Sphingomonas sp. BIUV-7]|uniref:IclR family transcriptional regulator C-terminal domain-containing protein n=1 Tax=Sphingomonas natans TaxID=3063330 RepID=A0ABT8Y3E1_9SPHN|nr:IclR family transcriptional regulator C-terminal domain-containing protein [Sphingomonas sp. BIUV-7]MDO6412826.1 IclR family transcriptional regulator C-terminal domain-containing protein [Sphingomonas sp. BIUV-7]
MSEDTLLQTETEKRAGTVGAQTLERGLDMLERIVAQPMRMPALLRQSGLSKTTTWRLVQALADRRFVAISASGEFHAGPKLLQLGSCAQEQIDLLLIARRHLDDLAAETGHSAFLGRRDGDYSVHLHRSAGNERVAVTTAPGTRRRLAETSLGKALLLDASPAALRSAYEASDVAAALPDWLAEMHGYAAMGNVLNVGPPPDSIHAIAAPIRDVGGKIVAAISIASAGQYLGEHRMQTLAPCVRAAAAAISRALGWTPADGPAGDGAG